MALPAPIPLLNIPIVDHRGNVSKPWMMFFLSLQQRTGGASGEDDTGATAFALGLETDTSPFLPDVLGGALASEMLPGQVSSDNSGLANEITGQTGTVDGLKDALSQEVLYPQVVGAPTLTDIIQQVLNYERDFSIGSSAQQILSDILAPLVNSAVKDILANETLSASGTPQNAVSEMLLATSYPRTSVTEMTFAPVQNTFYTQAPVAITPTGSPMTIRAGRLISLSIDGNVTNLTYTRGAFSRNLTNSTPFVLLDPGDELIISYSTAPVLYAIPR